MAIPRRKKNNTSANDCARPFSVKEMRRTQRISWLKLRKPTAIDNNQANLNMALHPNEGQYAYADVENSCQIDGRIEFEEKKPYEAHDCYTKGSADGVDLVEHADRLAHIAPDARHVCDQDRQ